MVINTIGNIMANKKCPFGSGGGVSTVGNRNRAAGQHRRERTP